MNTDLSATAINLENKYPGFICGGNCKTCLLHSWRLIYDTSNVFNIDECNTCMIKEFNLEVLAKGEYAGRCLKLAAYDKMYDKDNQFICQYDGKSDECQYCEVTGYARCVGYKITNESEDQWRIFKSPSGKHYTCKALLQKLCGVSVIENSKYREYASVLINSDKLAIMKNQLKTEILAQTGGAYKENLDNKKIANTVSKYISFITNDVSDGTMRSIRKHQITIAEASVIRIQEIKEHTKLLEERARLRKEQEFQDKLAYYRELLYDLKDNEFYHGIFDAPVCCNECAKCRIYRNIYRSHGIVLTTEEEMMTKCAIYANQYKSEIIAMFRYFQVSKFVDTENHGGINRNTTIDELKKMVRFYVQSYLRSQKRKMNKKEKE